MKPMSGKLPRLALVESIDLPVVEASGVTVRRTARGSVVLVVGDRTAEVGVCSIGDDGELGDWTTIDLAALPGWPLPPGDSQLEAIATDGGSVVALMCEDPPLVLVADTITREFRAQIQLTAPTGSVLEGQWDDASSRGEGLLFLRGGRLLVAQEKRPRALIEFGPIGTEPAGVSTDDLLGSGESWDAPTGQVEFVPLSMWTLKGKAKQALGDVSSIAADSDGNLWLLSDKSQRVGRIGLDRPLAPDDDQVRDLDELWRLPKGAEKPEGIAALGDGRVLVALDTRSTSGNGLIVTRPFS
jgi:hypothetical protein